MMSILQIHLLLVLTPYVMGKNPMVSGWDFPKLPAQVMSPKASGAWHLHDLGEDLELFVLFSSVSATIGIPNKNKGRGRVCDVDG